MLNRCVHFAQRQMAFVAPPQERIIHLDVGAFDVKVQGNFSISPDQLAVAHRQAIDGKGKKLLDRRGARRSRQLSNRRDVGCRPIRANDDVHDRTLKRERLKPEFRSQK